MAVNQYLKPDVRSEQTLYEDIIIESIKNYGQDVIYMPRDLVNVDTIFQDDAVSKFSSAYRIEMYIENTEGFDGDGDLFSKFGVEIRDEATFIMARRRWLKQVSYVNNAIDFYRPREGDLIYLPLSKSIFEITKVEDESPFYQLSNLPVFKMRCQLFEYSDEDMDTGVAAIDGIENTGYTKEFVLQSHTLQFEIGETVRKVIDSDNSIYLDAEVTAWNDATNTLSVAHIGRSDGKFAEYADSDSLTGLTTGATGIISTRTENLDINDTNQNAEFDTFATDFIDFSETNPFGDPV